MNCKLMDTDYLAERIIKDLDGIFAKDPHIADFEILPVEECTKNKCPVIHVAHQVGLESWCVKHVFQYAYKNTLEWRISHQQSNIPCLLGWTRALLLINPDIPVAWNIRKELVISEKQDISSELKFSEIALSRKPKSSETFIHRRWILTEFMKLNNASKISPIQADIEFQLCNKAAENYPQNYYAWNHRIWVIQSIDASHYQVVRLELQNSDAWTQKHISDHSGFHYRQFLYTWLIDNMTNDESLSSVKKSYQSDMRKLSDTEENALSLLLSELETNAESILFYDDGHESLWYHRRFILSTLKSIVPILNDNVDTSQNRQNAKRTKLDILKECFNLGNEEHFIDRVSEKVWDDVSNAQKIFLDKHIQWLRRFFAETLPSEDNPKI